MIRSALLISAFHFAALVSLPYNPVNMTFLGKLLTRPANEKPFMILVAGYQADDALAPDLPKEDLGDFTVFI